MLLSEEPDPIDHLLGPLARGGETFRETRVLALEKLHPFRRNDAFHSRRLESFEPRLRLERAAAERRQLVTEVLDQLLKLRKGGSFRSYAV
jgi:hypothetical protein